MTRYSLYYLEGKIYATIAQEPQDSYHVAVVELDLEDLTDVLDLMQAASDTCLVALAQGAEQIKKGQTIQPGRLGETDDGKMFQQNDDGTWTPIIITTNKGDVN